MKSFASVALLSAALVAAVPLNDKRDIVWHTTWTEVTETVMTTTTKWVAPGSEVSAAAVNPGGDFHETAVQYSKPAYNNPSKTPVAAVPTSSPYVAPPPPPPPAPTTPTSVYVAPVPTTYEAPAPKPTTTSEYVAPAPTTTSVYVAPTPTYVYTPPVEPTTTAAAATTPASYGGSSGSNWGSGSGSGSSGSSSGGSSYSGVDLTYYAPGLGSCGITSSDGDMIVAVAASTMHQSYSGNPNNNPLCGKKISLTANGVTETATIVDTCPGCKGPTDLDLSPALFQKFADESVGVVTGASWKLLD